ncbi:hypothetical protein [Aureibacillus halotolerans]|uniref:Uncharacterized protein n=1 Tax=Aureibacillus halotolerans TaxID=1508390 RepID=A0A4R6U4V8_9BACI|nr:hypothetical protein [Aureibacillus halotolerans]TDQ40756.1 hypothetical protein EV213_105102 [Aureibacillus halotolerans]
MHTSLKLMEIHVNVLFKQVKNRLVSANGPEGDDAPLLFLGQTSEGRVLRFHQHLEGRQVEKVKAFLDDSHSPLNVAEFVRLVKGS